MLLDVYATWHPHQHEYWCTIMFWWWVFVGGHLEIPGIKQLNLLQHHMHCLEHVVTRTTVS